MTTYKIHPLAELFPPFTDPEFDSLLKDISAHGLREPIILFEGKILDGVHRFKACQKLNVEPRVRNYTGNDPTSFAISENLHRRHLNESQRSVIAAKLTGVKSNGYKPNSALMQSSKLTTTAAAKQLNVSPRSVETAKTLIREAPKQIVQQVAAGAKKLVTAVKEIKQAKAAHVDKIGCPIPDDVYPDWQAAEAREDILRQTHRLKLTVEKALDENDLSFREITNSTTADLHNAWSALQGLIPYAVCPTCEGHNRKSCTLCKQRGFLSRFGYEHWISKKARELREKLYA